MNGWQFSDALPAAAISIGLSVPRLLVFLIVVPLFPSSVYPSLLRVGIAIGLGAPVAAGIFHQLGPQTVDITVLIVLKEALLGLLLGVVAAVPIWAIESAGVLIDNQRGANAAQQVTPFAQADSSVLGAALMQALIVLTLASGAFSLLYELLLHSYGVWPVLELTPAVSQAGFQLAAAHFGDFLLRAVLYAAPVIAIIMLVDFAFALMGIYAPQLQTYFAAMPIKSLAALSVLVLYLVVLLSHGEDYFFETLRKAPAAIESVR